MEASVDFLLRWRGIVATDNNQWVHGYLSMFHSYIQPGVTFGELNALNFSILKSEKTSRAKIRCELPQNMLADDSDDDPEVVMVTGKD